MTRLAVAISASLLSGCATLTVGSYADRYADFSRFRTYDWAAADSLPSGDPRLDNNPFFIDVFQGAVERGLADRGYQKAFRELPDLLLHYHATVRQRINVGSVDRNAANCTTPLCEPHATDYDEATLMLDVLDGRTATLVWRGWAQTPLNGIIANQDKLQRLVVNAVTRMLNELPITHPRPLPASFTRIRVLPPSLAARQTGGRPSTSGLISKRTNNR